MSRHVVEDQSATIALLDDPATHGGLPVRTVTTPISHVALAGDRAWKLKRAVRYPFVDFSTADRRRTACLAEVAVNRRTAPGLYLGVAPVVRRGGRLALGAVGEDPAGAVDWVVAMRRFDEAALLDRMAAAGTLTPAIVGQAAAAVAALHAGAERRAGEDGHTAFERIIAGNAEGMAEHAGLFPRAEALTDACRAALGRASRLLDARAKAGCVRRGHGDLHLRNLCLLDGRLTPFDAIEFNDDLAVIDIAYDMAFLVMDLERRGLRPLANLALNRWLDATDDVESLAALPLFLALRAAVRAKVAAEAEGGGAAAEARAFFALAERCLAPAPPALTAVGGLSGTGKTTLARALAPWLGPAPGALLTRSDVVRKALAGTPETARLPREAYGPASSGPVYRMLLERSERALRAGHAAVVDAVAARPSERRAFADLALRLGVPFAGLWLEAPQGVLEARVAARVADASDADATVVRAQAAYDTGPMDWTRIDASGTPESVLAAARAHLRERIPMEDPSCAP